MVAIEATAQRCRGRPQVRSDAETRHRIAEAAAVEFMANGYAGTSMDCVAKTAGISKKTLYRLVPTKADLFRTCLSDRIDRFMLAIDPEATKALDFDAALERILIELGRLTLSAETIAIQRLVIAEGDRFPELVLSFSAEAVSAVHRLLEDYLRNRCASGALVLDDPHEAAGMLRGMMVMEPQRNVMLGLGALLTVDQIDARARTCAKLFLRGCRAPAHSS